jgi:ribonuclease Y
MIQIYILVIIAVVGAGFAFFLGWYLSSRSGQNKITTAEERAKQVLDNAAKEATSIKKEKLIEVKDEWYKKKQEFDSDVNSKRNKLSDRKSVV